MITSEYRKKLGELKKEYDNLSKGRESLLGIISEAELPESVYNSNAIENSTLTISETEKILMELEVSRDVSVREIFEAKNLARVFEYIRTKLSGLTLDKELILFLHDMLIRSIDESIAGRFRKMGEYVRVGTHIAPAPEHVESMIESVLLEYSSDVESFIVEKIAKFHLDFETVHPFCDGNGRIGRVLINFQLMKAGFPSLIVRDKEKQEYYDSFKEYRNKEKTDVMERILLLGLYGSLHKRITYLKGQKIIKAVDYAREIGETTQSVLNKAARQTLPAFREKGVWKIGIDK